MTNEFRERMLPQWEQLLHGVFPYALPRTAVWTRIPDIVSVLQCVSQIPNLNHLFFPTSGGLDLTGASVSLEPECIDLEFGRSASIVRPTALSCEIVHSDLEFSNFRLDCDRLEPTDVYDDLAFEHEELVQLSDGRYLDRSLWDRGYMTHDSDGNEVPFPDDARVVVRHLSGAFVIFCKASAYNMNSSTYDGRHSRMSSEQFRTYIDQTVARQQIEAG